MICLVTGGASSGKSAWAEQLACALPGQRVYLAAMKPFGEEGARRIARHRALRAGKGFVTVECYEGLQLLSADGVQAAIDAELGGAGTHAPRAATALLESLGNVVANELFADDWSMRAYDEALAAVDEGVQRAASLFGNLVVVGDEVGGDGIRYDVSTRIYQDLIGTTACKIAARSALVVECVAGQPFVVKDELKQRGLLDGLLNVERR